MLTESIILVEMLLFILLIVFGGVMVYLAQNNLMLVTLHLGPYVFSDIPLFYTLIGSLLTGFGLAYIIYLINSILTTFTIYGKNSKIKQAKGEIAELTKQIHKLELENERLKNNSIDDETQDDNAM